jgi:hypothetical protein
LKSATQGTKRAKSGPEHKIYSDFGSDGKDFTPPRKKRAKTQKKKITSKEKEILAAAEIAKCSCEISDS